MRHDALVTQNKSSKIVYSTFSDITERTVKRVGALAPHARCYMSFVCLHVAPILLTLSGVKIPLKFIDIPLQTFYCA